jgi:hypothetical protein
MTWDKHSPAHENTMHFLSAAHGETTEIVEIKIY